VVSYGVSPALPAGLSLNPTTGILTGTPTGPSATANYTVTASNSGGSATASLVMTVLPRAPIIATQPVGQTVEAGQSATFRVEASGTGQLSYQWRKNGSAIPLATSDSYTLQATLLADDGALISVVVSDALGSTATSADATLTVLSLPRQRVVLSELCAANASGLMGDLHNNNYTNYLEWIEITNTGSDAFDLTNFCLTNDLAVPGKWLIPSTVVAPGHAVIFWADGVGLSDHMNFKLKQTGGTLALFSPAQVLVHSVTYPAQVTDISYGLAPGGGPADWRFQASPTPRAPNVGVMATSANRTAPPVFSVSPGFHPSATAVSITAEGGVSIRYTTDGSIPTSNADLYTGPILLTGTKVLKARAFSATAMPSLVTAGSYFIGETSTLPVVSVSTDPKNLWDQDMGIYAMGNSAETQPPYFGANFWQDWERPTHVELFEKDGARTLNAFGGLKINGSTTVGVPEKSLSFSAKTKYDGLSAFAGMLFPDKPTVTSYPRFLVRNSGQDWAVTQFRDALTAWVIKDQMTIDAEDRGLDYQAYRPVLHYLNGQFQGVINLREKADAYFPVSNWGATSGKVDFLEQDGANLVVSDGSATHYNALIAYLKANDPKLPGTYEEIKTRMDVEEFMNYVIVETFCGNYDWPASNVKLWHAQTTGAKWRWILQDTDFAWGYLSETWTALDAGLDMFHKVLDPVGAAWPNPPEGTFLFRSLIQNDAFRARFLAKYQYHLDSTFQPARIHGVIDAIQAAMEPEMQRQVDRWGGQVDGLVDSPYRYPTSKAEWLAHAARVRAYVDQRPDFVRAQLAAHFPSGGLVP